MEKKQEAICKTEKNGKGAKRFYSSLMRLRNSCFYQRKTGKEVEH
jgi:hypothetical protein